jgi:hypothetical protein
MQLEARRWLRAADVSDRLGLAPDVAASVLARLCGRSLVEHDGERPRAFARTTRGDCALEWTP